MQFHSGLHKVVVISVSACSVVSDPLSLFLHLDPEPTVSPNCAPLLLPSPLHVLSSYNNPGCNRNSVHNGWKEGGRETDKQMDG